jgi:RNA polymerase sigma-70 factor, ECF subfamily
MPPTFTTLLATYEPRVHRAALGLLGDEQEAHEIAQDALAKAWAARHRYDASRPFYPWLYTIVKNLCRDAKARSRHRARPGLESERVVSAAPSPLSALSAAQAQASVRAAMDHLREDQREIIAMRHFQDLSYAEIGELLDLPQGTVMSRLFRARRALLTLLQEAP